MLLKEAGLSSNRAGEKLNMQYFLEVKHLLEQMNALEHGMRAYFKINSKERQGNSLASVFT